MSLHFTEKYVTILSDYVFIIPKISRMLISECQQKFHLKYVAELRLFLLEKRLTVRIKNESFIDQWQSASVRVYVYCA